MKANFKSGWHVLYVKSRHEKKVETRLKEIQLQPFLPLVKTVRQWSDRKKIINVPLFPSYIFVKINSPTNLHMALSVDGASAYIRFGNKYGIVSEDEINKIKFLVNEPALTAIETTTDKIAVGEIRTINYGILSGLKCEILKVKNQNKIIVRVHSIGQNIVATLPKAYLDKPL